MKSKCDNIISLKQYGPTCWFNSILMALLYSEESRKLLLKKSEKWNKKIKIYNTIKYILENKYLRTDNIYNDYIYFDKIRPEYILKELHKYNKKKFNFDPIKNKKNGYKSALYIRKIYKLLGVKILFLDYDNNNNKLYYSLFNNVNVKKMKDNRIAFKFQFKTKETIDKYSKDPDVIIIHIDQNNVPYNDYPIYYQLADNKFENILNNFKTNQDKIIYSNNEYINDSILLTNWNKSIDGIGGHSIAGITCKDEKYVYNGWTRTTVDPNIKNIWSKIKKNNNTFYYNKFLNKSVWYKDLPSDANIVENNYSIPCELMKFNWSSNQKADDFCLNQKTCNLDNIDLKDKKQCFSFNKGSRELIYIKKENNSKLNIKIRQCPEGKIINPLTNRCIKIKSINKLPNKNLSKPEKNCPEGKIVNPLTNRCIKIKSINKLEKICPEGKIVNPKTGRCIKEIIK